jgi:hypothetical protein
MKEEKRRRKTKEKGPLWLFSFVIKKFEGMRVLERR